MYDGAEDATPPRVRRYLKENYTDPDGTALSDARLTELLTDHAEHMKTGAERGSYAYYVGDNIASDAGLIPVDAEDGEAESGIEQ